LVNEEEEKGFSPAWMLEDGSYERAGRGMSNDIQPEVGQDEQGGHDEADVQEGGHLVEETVQGE
jgi:hypothetical protein